MKAVVVLFLILLQFSTNNACSCKAVDESTPEFLCCRDYVLRGQVEKETLLGNKSMPDTRYRVYTISVQQIYKGMDKISSITGGNTSYVQIKTPEDGAACGVEIRPFHKDLVISGMFSDMTLSMFSMYRCDSWYEEWKTLSDKFKSFFTESVKTCKCAASSVYPLQGFILLVGFLNTFFNL